jgi:hypothetical protein
MRPIHPDIMQLGEQVLHLGIIATVSAWMTWLWVHEDIFADIQRWLKRRLREHKAMMKVLYHEEPRRWNQILKQWFIQKLCFGLTCPTCVIHYPCFIFAAIGRYRLIASGWWGFLYAWMFMAFTGDTVLWVLDVMKKGKALEQSTSEAVDAGVTILKRKIKHDEASDSALFLKSQLDIEKARQMGNPVPDEGTGTHNPVNGPSI